jgi:predicted aspartyl protease
LSTPHGYDRSYSPPALILQVTVRHPVLTKSVTVPAKIDTGADASAIPSSVKDELRLEPAGEANVTGYKNKRKKKEAVYYVGFTVEGYQSNLASVIATEKDYALLGRNVLNQLKLTADGKNERFTLEDP